MQVRLGARQKSGVSANSGQNAEPQTPNLKPQTHTPLRLLTSALNCDALYPGIIVRAETHDIRIVFESVVNDSTIVGIHGLKLNRSARNSDRVSYLANALPKSVVPHGSPVTDIHLNARRISVVRLKYSIQKKLQILERFALVTDQCITLCSENLELATVLSFDFLDFRYKAEITEHRI
jgi:hypothetical protein